VPKPREVLEDIALTADLYKEIAMRGRSVIMEVPGRGPDIVVVHGIFGGFHSSLENYFKKRKQHTFLLDWGVQTDHFDYYVNKLVSFLADNKIEYPILLGMSVGGLVAIECANRIGWNKVHKVITVATPYRGIGAIKIADIFDGVRELRRDSIFLQSILDPKIPQEKLFCIRGQHDYMLIEDGKPPDGVEECILPFNIHSKNQHITPEMVKILNTLLK
jgi:pimeloyl-ACP methyl ester carboxylesterase